MSDSMAGKCLSCGQSRAGTPMPVNSIDEWQDRTLAEENAKLKAAISALSKDPDMADEYVLAQINADLRAENEKLKVALAEIAAMKQTFRARTVWGGVLVCGSLSDATKIARKALEQER